MTGEENVQEYIAKMVATYTEIANDQSMLLDAWSEETYDEHDKNKIKAAKYVIDEQNKALRFVGETYMKLADKVELYLKSQDDGS